VLDPQEIRPKIKDPALVLDMETGDTIEVTPDYVKHEYGAKIDAHVTALRERAKRSGIDYFLLDTSQPLDAALRNYLGETGEELGKWVFSLHGFSAGCSRRGFRCMCIC